MIDFDKVKEEIDNLFDYEKIGLWNEYCEHNNYSDRIYGNDINERLYGLSPLEVLEAIDLNEYKISDDYCTYDGYGDIVSFSGLEENNSPFDLDSVAQWCYDEEDGRGYFDIDDCDDGEEDEE